MKIRITEDSLTKIIKESIQKVLNEGMNDDRTK